MVKRIGSARRKTRHKLKQNYRKKGKIPLSKYFQEFKKGEQVALIVNPSLAKGRFFPRFHGKVGTIVGKKGRCYQIALKEKSKLKTLYVHPLHLKKIKT